MSSRFTTLHPYYGRGVFVSRAGIAVLQAIDPTLFLLHSNYKTEQVLMTGIYSGQPTYFPEVLPSAPIILFQTSENQGDVDLPWRELTVTRGVSEQSLWRRFSRVVAYTYSTHFTVFNQSVINYYCHYMVLAKEIGG